MFRFGVSFGRNDLNLGHLQMGYSSKTIKNYGHIDNKTTVLEENMSPVTTIPQDSETAESEM